MKILFISGLNEKLSSLNDFMHDIVLLGLREVYGDDVVDYPGAWYMYFDEVKKKTTIFITYGVRDLHFTIYYLIIKR